VLIAEDDDAMREVFAWCMQAAGWQVEQVTNGEEALVAAARFDPDVIIMDLHMPVLDGIAATRRLKRDPRTAHIPVIACTAQLLEHLFAELRDAGFHDVVPKPCAAEDMRTLLENLVTKR
jgi:CheY-like chemotaxis protein